MCVSFIFIVLYAPPDVNAHVDKAVYREHAQGFMSLRIGCRDSESDNNDDEADDIPELGTIHKYWTNHILLC